MKFMKKLITPVLLATGLLLLSNATHATVINFDNSTPSSTNWTSSGVGVVGNATAAFNGHYSESGFTLTATINTALFTFDAITNSTYAFNSTDFGYFESRVHGTGTRAITLSAASLFSLQSFNAANIFNYTGNSVTVTGHVNGGGTLSQVFTTQGGNRWSLFSLTGWNNLTSVDIAGANDAIALDNINVTTAIPEPSVLLLLSSVMASVFLFKRIPQRAAVLRA